MPHTVHVHYPASGQVYYERLRHASIFHDVAQIAAQPISKPGVIAETAQWQLSTLKLDHGVEAWGYRLQERDGRTMLPERLAAAGIHGPAVGQLLRDGQIVHAGRTVTLESVSTLRRGQSLAFVMDTRRCANAVALARDVDLLVCESTYLHADADKAHDHGHLTAVQAAEIAAEAGARKLVLTHFSQRYNNVEAFVAEARPIFPDVVAARDGMRVAVPPRM